MTGNDVTEDELATAAAFLSASNNEPPEVFRMTRDAFINLLAWYAAVRLEGVGKRGVGPGTFVTQRRS